MKRLVIERVAVQDVGVLRGRVDIGELDSGLTLITGSNETGKSTLVAALRAALFENHVSKHKGLRTLQTHGTDLAPSVWVTFSIGEDRYELAKRFLSKPSATLSLNGGTRIWTGSEAEEALRERLGTRAPGKQGAKAGDLGVWGLLWVTQDEAAFSDPGQQLDPDVRGALQEAIGRQVAQVLGGRHGERLRAAVLDQHSGYFTAQTGKPTGVYRQAIESETAARDLVRQIETAVQEVEMLADATEASDARLDELARERPSLEEELEVARTAALALAGLRTMADACAARAETALHVSDRAAEAVAQRRIDAEAAETAHGAAERAHEVMEEFERALEVHRSADRTAQVAQETTQGALVEAEEAETEHSASLGAARTMVESRVRRAQLDKAKGLAAELAALADDGDVVSDDVYQEIRRLERERDRLARELDALGTRFVVGSLNVVLGRERTLEVEGVGAVRCVPSRAELSGALDERRTAQAALSEALRTCGVESMEAAGDQRRRRVELEAKAEQSANRLTDLAAGGVEAVRAATEVAKNQLVASRSLLTRALAADEARSTAAGKMEDSGVDDVSLGRIQERSQNVEVARARSEASGTALTIKAKKAMTIQLDGGAAVRLAKGKTREWRLSERTTVALADIADVIVEPGGQDVLQARLRLETAESELAGALEGAGADDLADAQARGRRWRSAEADHRTATALLGEVAPDGASALAEDVAGLEQAWTELTKRAAEASQEAVRQAGLADRLAEHLVDAEALKRLDELEGVRIRAAARVEDQAARLTLGESGTTVVIDEAGEHELGGRIWTVSPGAGGEDAEAGAQAAQTRLAEALEAAELADLAEAESRWRAGLTLVEHRRGLADRLNDCAPQGLTALEEAVAESLAVSGDGEIDLQELEARASATRKAMGERRLAAEGAAHTAAAAMAERVRREADARVQVGAREAARDEALALETRLATAREEQDDALLVARSKEALAASSKANEAEQQAADRLAEAAPEVLADVVERASTALDAASRLEADERKERTRLDTLLGKAAAEGRFEELADARAELAEAEREHARTAGHARAVDVLRAHVDRAYDAAQHRFLAPVVEAAQPYLNSLRPGSRLQMTPNLTLGGVVRDGTTEAFDRLSGGTREQLSVIVRLALATVLAKDGLALPLILDDTMGWTDDARFVKMMHILRRASDDLQIILLSCHPSRFTRLGAGRTIALDRLTGSGSEAPPSSSLPSGTVS